MPSNEPRSAARQVTCAAVVLASLWASPLWAGPLVASSSENPRATAGTHADDPATPPIVASGPPDVFTTRAAAGMLANVVEQAVLVPESDFIQRLAQAGTWPEAPELAALFPEAKRLQRVPVPSTQFYVVDDGKGDDITVLIPRPDPGVLTSILGQSLRLDLIADSDSLPEELRQTLAPVLAVAQETAPTPTASGDPGSPASTAAIATALYTIRRGDARAGTMILAPADEAFSPGALAVRFIADPQPEAHGAAGARPSMLLPDGSIQLSDGSVLRGQGTAEKPYELSWDLLVSAERSYQPRQGMTTLPDWVALLDSKRVRLTGHLLSPLMMDETDQILVMRNQWDGCCIGVPPTPYDAVEVTLAKPVSLVREQINYGTLSGRFIIDPYLVNNWLVGLYVLEDAKIEGTQAQTWGVTPSAPN